MTRIITHVFGPVFAAMMFAASGVFAQPVQHGTLALDHIVIRAGLPGAKVTAGYLDITNTGAADDRLIAVEYDGAGRAEIHTMEMENGIMKMRPLKDGLIIPAGETVSLAPGGLHLMFMKLKALPKAGDHGQLTLEFERAGPVTIMAHVKTVKMGHKHTKTRDGHDHGGHDHDH